VRLPEGWRWVILEDIADIRNSNVDKKTQADETPVQLCNYMDVYENEYITRNMEFMCATATKKELTQFSLRPGDVVLTKDSETREDIAATAVVKGAASKLLCGYHLTIIRPHPDKVQPVFLAKLLVSTPIHAHFVRYANGVTRFGLTLSSIRSLRIPLPPLPEQRKIAEILGTWDEAIALTEQCIAAARQRKKGLMQQLLTGKRRFKEFEGETWGEARLEVACDSMTSGGTPSTKVPEYWTGNIPWVTGADFNELKISQIRRHITSDAVAHSSAHVAQKGDILLVSRTGVGKMAIAPFDIAISQDITCLKLGQGLDTEFFLNMLYWTIPALARFNQGTSINGVTRKDLKRHLISLPSLQEQRRIATVLRTCDEEIDLLNRKLVALQRQKKGLMQRLLTGRVRVKVC